MTQPFTVPSLANETTPRASNAVQRHLKATRDSVKYKQHAYNVTYETFLNWTVGVEGGEARVLRCSVTITGVLF